MINSMASRQRSSGSNETTEYNYKWDDKHIWEQFAKFGNATATEMTGKNFDKMLKDAGVLDPKGVSTTITGIAFSKVTGPKRKTLNYPETRKVLALVAEDRARQTKAEAQAELDAICSRLANLEGPSRAAVPTDAKKVVDRLTDPKLYTGAHKQRFDETGKGKGKAGREDLVEKTGYVSGYKNKDTYGGGK